MKLFPKTFTNVVFVSVGAIDSGNFKGAEEMNKLREKVLRIFVDSAEPLICRRVLHAGHRADLLSIRERHHNSQRHFVARKQTLRRFRGCWRILKFVQQCLQRADQEERHGDAEHR